MESVAHSRHSNGGDTRHQRQAAGSHPGARAVLPFHSPVAAPHPLAVRTMAPIIIGQPKPTPAGPRLEEP